MARRASIGIGRGGTPGGNSSGDIFLAFSVANPLPLMQVAKARLQFESLNDSVFDALYLSIVEAVEEAVEVVIEAKDDNDQLLVETLLLVLKETFVRSRKKEQTELS